MNKSYSIDPRSPLIPIIDNIFKISGPIDSFCICFHMATRPKFLADRTNFGEKYIPTQIKWTGMKYLLFIILLVAILVTAGCVARNQNTPVIPTSQTVQTISNEPIVGNWQWTTNDVTKIYKFYFFPDGRYSYTDPINNITVSGRWDTIRENVYNVTYLDGRTQTIVYNRTTDTFTIPEFSQVLAYRLGKEPVAPIPTTVPTAVETTAPIVTTTLTIKTSIPTAQPVYQTQPTVAVTAARTTSSEGRCPTGECWVNSYYGETGVYVHGYCRSC